MLKSGSSDASSSGADKIFTGVRFVLFGFDSVSEAQYRSELVGGGGADAGRYDASCTHVIVSGRVYDDPVCVAARQDGKIVVTELWVDDSLDLGTRADASRVLYRPPKDLNGIPGSESLFICLTGYQKQQRDDVMKMVSLMGARFSKPLIASQVTHLICYKFEGEKYELANKVKIKLVNHRWLEDCLKAWEVLPIDNYKISGYDLELLEAEAMDSEEETEDPHTELLRQRSALQAPRLEGDVPAPAGSRLNTPIRGMPNNQPEATNLSQAAEIHHAGQKFSTPLKKTNFGECFSKHNPDNKLEVGHQEDGNIVHNSGNCQNQEADPEDVDLQKESNALPSNVLTTKLGLASHRLSKRHGPLGYSGETPKKEVQMGKPSAYDKGDLKDDICNGSPRISPVEARSECKPDCLQNPTASSALPQKRKVFDFGLSSESPKIEEKGLKFLRQSPTKTVVDQLEPASMTTVHNKGADKGSSLEFGPASNSKESQHTAPSKLKYSSNKKRCLKRAHPASETKPPNTGDSPSSERVKNAQQMLERDQSMGSEVRSPEPKASVSASSSDGKGLLDFLSHGKPKEPANMERSLQKTASSSERMAVSGRSKEVNSIKEQANEPFGNLGAPDLAAKSENAGDAVMKDIPNATAKSQWKKKSIRATSLGTKDSETRKFSSIPSASEENANKELSAGCSKKVVSRSSLGCKPNVSTGSMHKGKGVSTKDKAMTPKKSETKDKTMTPKKPEAKLREMGEVDTERFEKVTDNGKKETVESAPNVVVGEDRAKPSKPCKKPLSGRSRENKSVDQMEITTDPEKENKPKESDITSSLVNFRPSSKVLCEDRMNSRQKTETIGKPKINKKQMNEHERVVKPEPAWFILTGHRFQRKEFQAVIRRLRGRVCRDSHNWSYQATHFIVPEPVRRTEKFFAAAAAGRWILRPDYLTASSEAGKFLDEEPFEWYKSGLTEDGAINLEAPRKWRHLREKTGHGALHGMRIIVYGECIAPSLDTLKRVVKAGGGTILATAPPYSRFLKSGIDYAVVSPSMPRVDSWVQEFLRHEIPCVVADYLVEFVCKPGYPLERHVLYNTQAWAEKSFANMLSKSEEIVTDSAETSEDDADDISCSVCRSREREEVMLICGNEDGSIGCGVGMHIDCCKPPLVAVPEGDWFCVNCTKEIEPKMAPRKSTKRKSSKCK